MAQTLVKEVVLAENKIQGLQEECKKLEKTRDAMQSEIDRKTADYNIYIAQRDTDSKRMRQDVLDQNDQLAKDKAEFQGILRQFQVEKAAFADQSKIVADQNAKHQEQMNNVRQFVIAVQRAVSILGI